MPMSIDSLPSDARQCLARYCVHRSPRFLPRMWHRHWTPDHEKGQPRWPFDFLIDITERALAEIDAGGGFVAGGLRQQLGQQLAVANDRRNDT